MDTNTSLLLLIADLNAQVRALQEENAHLREELAQASAPSGAASADD